MKIAVFVLFLICLPVFLNIETRAQYENQYYLPLTKRELAKKFKIQYVGTLGNRRPGYFGDMKDKALPDTLYAGTGKVNVDVNGSGELTLSGKDRRGKTWKANLGNFPTAYACRFYVGDLDNNGFRDIVLVFPTGGNG